MKNQMLILVCLLCCLDVFSQEITVRGKINSRDSLMILFGNDVSIDTIFTKTGRFNFKRKLAHAELFTLAVVNTGTRAFDKVNFFMEKGTVVINSDFPGLGNIKLNMRKHDAHDKYQEFNRRFNPLVNVARSIIDSSFVEGRTDGEKAIFNHLYQRVSQIEDETAIQFILENTDNIIGAYIFYRYLHIADLERLASIYGKFNSSLYATRFLKQTKERIHALSNIQAGRPAPGFSAITDQGALFNLSDLKGKYVVLDFWGTWCPPCIAGFPKMKAYYSKYSDKVEFVGIACNETNTDWIDAVKKHHLQWIQVSSNRKLDDLVAKYNIESYPTKVLIDKAGRIVKIFTGETTEFYKNLDEVLK